MKSNKAPWKKSGFLLLTILIITVVVLGKCSQSKQNHLEQAKKNAGKEKVPPVNVVIMEMLPGEIMDRIDLPGTLAPWVSIMVSSEVAGRIIHKKVNEGDIITRGTVLCEIDRSKYQNVYNSTKASYENALTKKKRLEALYRSEISNKADLDAITAELENAEAAMKTAAIDLEHTLIKAPVSGIVNTLYIETGQFTDTGKQIAELIQIDPIKVKVGIPESDVNDMTGIQEFDVTVDALKGRVFKGRKHSLSKTTHSLARVYDLELTVDNKTGELLPDMFVRVNIVKKKVANALFVPLYAVISANGRQYVYVAEKDPNHDILEAAFRILGIDMEAPQDTAVRKEVQTGIQDGWMVEVKSGIVPGDDVITVGQRNVTHGQKIHIIRTRDEHESMLQ